MVDIVLLSVGGKGLCNDGLISQESMVLRNFSRECFLLHLT